MASKASFVVLLLAASFTAAYHTGAPDAACDTMTPGHGPQPQTISSPFLVSITKAKSAGEPIDITLITSENGGVPFRGFFVQVRAAGGNEPVGQFNPKSDSQAQAVTCGGNSNAAMTHINNDNKTRVVVQWSPPAGDGEYDALATFVQTKEVFWVKQMANKQITVSSAAGKAASPSAAGHPQQSKPSSGEVTTPNPSNSKSNNSSSSQPPSEGGASNNMPWWTAISLTAATVMVSFIHFSHFRLL